MFDSPAFIVVISAVLGFFLKYAWDRFFASTSRVTRQECELMRSGCMLIRETNKANFLRMIDENKEEVHELLEGDEKCKARRNAIRGQTLRLLRVILLAQLKICDKLELDCEELAKAVVEVGEVDI